MNSFKQKKIFEDFYMIFLAIIYETNLFSVDKGMPNFISGFALEALFGNHFLFLYLCRLQTLIRCRQLNLLI